MMVELKVDSSVVQAIKGMDGRQLSRIELKAVSQLQRDLFHFKAGSKVKLRFAKGSCIMMNEHDALYTHFKIVFKLCTNVDS